MFVPSNPFEALATSAIPAVVLFSILFGLALIAIPKKDAVLDVFSVMSKTLQRVTGFVVKITPLGVFGLTAAAAGTLDGDDVSRLQVYFVAYIGCSTFLTFVAFPMVMSLLTPFTYGQVARVSRNALITAFTTGNLFVVLPILIEDCQKMFKERCPDAKDAEFFIDILIPVTFNFPNMGKLTALLFIFFGGWYIGSPLPLAEYPQTVLTALPVFFGGIDSAVPYMLQIVGLPTDLFSLYILSGIITGRFATLLACMELLCFTLVAVSSLLGILQVNLRKILLGLMILLLGGLTLMGGARALLEKIVPTANEQVEFVQGMRVHQAVPAKVYSEPPSLPTQSLEDVEQVSKGSPPRKGFFSRVFSSSKETAAGSVRERTVLRVGFFPDNRPWSYTNGVGELAGYDVEAAHRLAAHLGCQLEFYPLLQAEAHRYLDAGEIDILMSGVPITTSNITRYTFSDFYLQLYLAVLLPKDPKLEDTISSLEKLKASDGIVVGYVPPSPFLPNIRAMLPNVELVEYPSYSEFFAAAGQSAKEVLTLEAGSALTLLHPEYKVQISGNRTVYNLAYPINPNDPDFLVFVNQWLAIESNLVSAESYNYWILETRGM